MKSIEEKIKILSDKYKLVLKDFVIVKKKNFFKKKYLIFYGANKYFFEFFDDSHVCNNYFPYFDFSKETDLENWISSIQLTLLKKSILLKSIKDGKSLRDSFKKKFKV
jgi:hypothetical protein